MEPRGRIDSTLQQEEFEELIDRIGPDAAHRLIVEAVERFAAGSRDESWRRRRERLLHVTRVLESNLDYDLRRLPAAG